MIIERAAQDDVYYVALDMRERDFEEFTAVNEADDRETLAAFLAERYGGRDDVLCASDDEGKPICIGGTILTRPGVITLLFFATDAFPRIALPLTKWIKRELFPRYFAAGVHRIEAVSMMGYEHAHKWLGVLGLAPETGPMIGYGKRGEAFVQFAMVKHVGKTGR